MNQVSSSADESWDAAVIGVGSVGAFALREFAQQGLRAIGIEQYSIAHDRSGAGGESRLLRICDLRSDEIQWALRSRSELLELQAQAGRTLFGSTGVLHIVPTDSPIPETMRAAAKEWGEGVEVFDAQRLRASFPRHLVSANEVGVLDRGAGWVRPELTVASAVEHAVSLGAEVRERTQVLSITRSDGAWTIATATGEIRAARIVVTPGSWAGELMPELAATTHVRRIVMTWFAVDRPSDFAGSGFPAWSRRHSDGTSSFGAPCVDGASVKIALTDSYGNYRSPDDLTATVDDAELDSVREFVRTSIDGVLPRVVRASVYMDLFANDDEFRIHPLDSTGTGVVATALSGRGFKIAPALGIDLARTVIGDEVPMLVKRRGFAPPAPLAD